MESVLEPLLHAHRLLGYATVLVIGPMVLLTWRRSDLHARWGRLYFFAMLLLYLTGTPRTFYFQAWPSWELARNFTFNFFGVLQVLVGYRAIRLWKQGGPPRWIDVLLTWLFRVNAVAMILVAPPDLPIFLIGWFALAVAVCDAVEWRFGPQDARMHMRRHLRHMFGSYYYLLTVLSIVHLPLEHDPKWLCCGTFGLAVWMLSRIRVRQGIPLLRGGMSLFVRSALAANGALALYVLGQTVHDWNVSVPSVTPTLDQKLAARWERFELARQTLIEQHRHGRIIDRGRWEVLLKSPEPYCLTAQESEQLRREQRRRIEANAAGARAQSSFDLNRIRRDDRLREFCRRLPKGGMLHVHPTGTLHPSTVAKLLEQVNPQVAPSRLPRRAAFDDDEKAFLHRYPDSARYHDLSPDDRHRMAQLFTMPSHSDDFERFEAIFSLVGRLCSDPQVDALAQICDAFWARAAEHRVSYVEFTTSIAPQSAHLDLWERLAARAESGFGVTLRVNAAFHRGAKEKENLERYEALASQLRERANGVVVGIDLLGQERNHPAFESGRQLYAARLADSNANRLHATMHAAGIGDLRNVRDAMLLGAERIGHGTRWPDDPTVLE